MRISFDKSRYISKSNSQPTCDYFQNHLIYFSLLIFLQPLLSLLSYQLCWCSLVQIIVGWCLVSEGQGHSPPSAVCAPPWPVLHFNFCSGTVASFEPWWTPSTLLYLWWGGVFSIDWFSVAAGLLWLLLEPASTILLHMPFCTAGIWAYWDEQSLEEEGTKETAKNARRLHGLRTSSIPSCQHQNAA